ncbi:MAG: HD-GYP domain-containing protein [Bacteriovoracaceae bacterium]|nr:HD-GYP domain-containing protein [Bacteriovoracaceae bacterium]
MKKTNNVFQIPSFTTAQALLTLAAEGERLKIENQKMAEMMARTILKALDCKDHYTFGHSMRVAYFSLVTGSELGLTEDEMKELELSAIFHDIGKIGTPDQVLNKPSRLTEEEFAIMKQHPELSYEILKEYPSLEKIGLNARYHHERYDGRGYPEGMKGEEIPLFARIILIADTFDAMTSTRPYRKGLDYSVAFDELNQFSGSQFDPKCVTAFIEGMRKESLKGEDEFLIPLLDRKFSKNAA